MGVDLPEDVVRQEANCAHNERLRERRQRRRAWSATRTAVRAQGKAPPLSLNPCRRTKKKKSLRLPSPHCGGTFPHLVTSSTGKWGSQSTHADQNGPRQRLGCRPAHLRNPASCYNPCVWQSLLTYSGFHRSHHVCRPLGALRLSWWGRPHRVLEEKSPRLEGPP
jgi:hypothetical protein